MNIREIVTTTVLILALLTISQAGAATALPCDCDDICANETGWWRDCGTFNASGTPIQAAVNAASSGDTIHVAAGNYTENVDITTPHLTLIGTGADEVTATAANSGDHVFYVTADYVNISGFTVTGVVGVSIAGIHLNGADHCNIYENAASNNDGNGIVLSACSNNNVVTDNTANSNSESGIGMDSSSYNTLLGNNVSGNGNCGILMVYLNNDNTIVSNNVSGNGNCGIVMVYSNNDNRVYNNYFNNTANACDDGFNTWNITKTEGTNIIGCSNISGNYWSDYAGNEEGSIVDTLIPYNCSGGIQNGGDYHPLVPCDDTTPPVIDTTPPVITIATPVPHELYLVGMALNFSATDNESGVATIVGNLTGTSGVSQIVNSSFAPPVGVYTLVVTATDNASNTNVSDPTFFVVYDPDGGRARGGGWFDQDGEDILPDGKAKFRFTARYKNDVPTGNLNFHHKDADIKLKSTSIDWLVIGSVSAQFQGTGTINGDGLYTFQVTAKDNGDLGADNDQFNIKIWEGTDIEADPCYEAQNTISSGNIRVHTK